MKIADIRKLSTSELTIKTSELRDEIVDLKRKKSMGETNNVRLVKNMRKDLARMLTVLSEQLMKEKI